MLAASVPQAADIHRVVLIRLSFSRSSFDRSVLPFDLSLVSCPLVVDRAGREEEERRTGRNLGVAKTDKNAMG